MALYLGTCCLSDVWDGLEPFTNRTDGPPTCGNEKWRVHSRHRKPNNLILIFHRAEGLQLHLQQSPPAVTTHSEQRHALALLCASARIALAGLLRVPHSLSNALRNFTRPSCLEHPRGRRSTRLLDLSRLCSFENPQKHTALMQDSVSSSLASLGPQALSPLCRRSVSTMLCLSHGPFVALSSPDSCSTTATNRLLLLHYIRCPRLPAVHNALGARALLGRILCVESEYVYAGDG